MLRAGERTRKCIRRASGPPKAAFITKIRTSCQSLSASAECEKAIANAQHSVGIPRLTCDSADGLTALINLVGATIVASTTHPLLFPETGKAVTTSLRSFEQKLRCCRPVLRLPCTLLSVEACWSFDPSASPSRLVPRSASYARTTIKKDAKSHLPDG